MKKQQTQNQQMNKQINKQQTEERRGSVIVVVLALLGALTLLGFLFYTLSAQQATNAANFSESAKVTESSGIDPDVLFDFALRQVIIGPDDREYNSALWGGRKSLLATMFGRDLHPFNGRGVNLYSDGMSPPVVDQDFNNVADSGDVTIPSSNQYYLNLNDSGGALGNTADNVSTNSLTNYPAPDVDYTAPGINSPFLSYQGVTYLNGSTRARVIIPSYHPLNLLRSAGTNDYQNSPNTRRVSLRPHSMHLAVTPSGKVSDKKRFITGSASSTDDFPLGKTNREGLFTDTSADATLNPTSTFTVNSSGVRIYNDEYDADPDNDGTKEAIWLDLDFPIQELPNGTKFIPIYAITIKDADGLLNLNAVGNVYGNTTLNNPANPFGFGTPISRSSDGLGSAEINPLPAMVAPLPAPTEMVQHNHFFGRNPTSAAEMANMEWWWLMSGRGNMTSANTYSQVYTGRWGEVNLLSAGLSTPVASRNPFLFPKPGVSFNGSNHIFADDNQNRGEGNAYRDTTGSVWSPLVWQQPFEHPLDFFGQGTIAQSSTPSNGRQREFRHYSYMRFPSYNDYFVHPGVAEPAGQDLDRDGNTSGDTALLSWSTYLGNQLMNTPLGGYQIDEPYETILDERETDSQTSDDTFPVSENAALALSNSDQSSISLSSRLQSLALHSFSNNSAKNPSGYSTRQRFTVTSWDIKTHGQTFWNSSNNKFRPWEFNADGDGDGNKEFPPRATIVQGENETLENIDYPSEIPPLTNQPEGPFIRSELRELMFEEQGERIQHFLQRRLSVNGLLEQFDLSSGGHKLRFRPLTSHPLSLPEDQIPSFAPSTQSPGVRPIGAALTNVQQQEWWARKDRQLMARDIYTLLYLFGGANDNVDYTQSNATRALYTDAQMQQMAQFAVNMVDALDPDDTITQFVYDKNIKNGWTNIDDGYHYPPKATNIERGMVRGVEQHRLSFSEAMAIFAQKVDDGSGNGTDHIATEYNDNQHSDFLFIELENASPHEVTFDNEAWQIVVSVSGGQSSTDTERRLTLTSTAPPVPSNGTTTRYAIGTSGGVYKNTAGDILDSQFKVDDTYVKTNPPPDFSLINPPVAPVGSLAVDLITGGNQTIDNADINMYRINEAHTEVGKDYKDGKEVTSNTTTPSGTKLLQLGTPAQQNNIASGGNVIVKLKLRRRLNLHRVRPEYENEVGSTQPDIDRVENESKDNPWVTVDTMDVELSKFLLKKDEDSTSIPKILDRLRGNNTLVPTIKGLFSKERKEVLSSNDGKVVLASTTNLLDPIRNTLGQDNQNNPVPYNGTTGGYRIWQPHFNRDFASVAELFTVPLYGPDTLLKNMGSTSGVEIIKENQTAGSLFLHPDRSGNTNRWHRILEFLEVPSRHHHSHNGTPSFVIDAGITGSPNTEIYRTPGRLNLNTIRHHQVLASLLDEPFVMNEYHGTSIPDIVEGGAARDWWIQFLQSRDGKDPYTGGYLPGVSTSRPFRNSNFSQRAIPVGGDPLADTVYRRLPADAGQPITQQRSLFELGTLADHNSKSVDITMKHRLLGKVVNNTTTRSNVFHVFIQVDYFAVTEQTYNGEKVYQIGKKLDTSPGYRGFFVIDRSRAMEQVTTSDLPPSPGTFSFNQNFNYHSLIQYRQIIK